MNNFRFKTREEFIKEGFENGRGMAWHRDMEGLQGREVYLEFNESLIAEYKYNEEDYEIYPEDVKRL